ncbi:unnamed protein product [Soboliphyme baturini]|uniref:Conjugative transfer protein TraN n=1 Tax=Soboliphyme baturini TaxID=241478 RepID=A0A183IWW6_9BILA|nr:unnamed protein product [Soboliphyme baturini]
MVESWFLVSSITADSSLFASNGSVMTAPLNTMLISPDYYVQETPAKVSSSGDSGYCYLLACDSQKYANYQSQSMQYGSGGCNAYSILYPQNSWMNPQLSAAGQAANQLYNLRNTVGANANTNALTLTGYPNKRML